MHLASKPKVQFQLIPGGRQPGDHPTRPPVAKEAIEPPTNQAKPTKAAVLPLMRLKQDKRVVICHSYDVGNIPCRDVALIAPPASHNSIPDFVNFLKQHGWEFLFTDKEKMPLEFDVDSHTDPGTSFVQITQQLLDYDEIEITTEIQAIHADFETGRGYFRPQPF